MTGSPPARVRARIPWLALSAILFVVLLTLVNALANVLPHHVPTTHELQQADQEATAAARRARIAEMLAEGDHCSAPRARELARALVFDGRSAAAYADDYERRCGADPIVRRWRAASRKLLGGTSMPTVPARTGRGRRPTGILRRADPFDL